ncbi:MAG TPA: hypothetical protein GXX60_03745 [Anaerolineaceae bacterium]|nr:hypothetical protein [Anaerolineaceae bacterium]
MLFQSTPPRGRRLDIHLLFYSSTHSFNPRLHAGGDEANNGVIPNTLVSIHASTREATKPLGIGFGGVLVSIHASTREAT